MGYREEMYEKKTFHLYTRVTNRLSTWQFLYQLSIIRILSTIIYTERSKNNIRILHKMDIIKRKIITVFFIVLSIGIILAIGYVITGKVPEAFDVIDTKRPIRHLQNITRKEIKNGESLKKMTGYKRSHHYH